MGMTFALYTLFIDRDDDDFKNTILTPQELRKVITNELSNYPLMYDLLLDQRSNPPRKVSPRAWEVRMRRDKEYADDIFIQLSSNFLKRKIARLQEKMNHFYSFYFLPLG